MKDQNKLEIEILENAIKYHHETANLIYQGHWLSMYNAEQRDSKMKEYKRLTGKDYDLTKLEDKNGNKT